MHVKIDHLTKRFGDFTAVGDFNMDFDDGKLTALLGPSGCGKSTMLNMLSGILPVTEGHIYFDEDDVTNMPPQDRGVGLVFQNYALYPHMSVLENIAFPLEIKRFRRRSARSAQRRWLSSCMWSSSSTASPRPCPAASSSVWRSRAR